MYKFLFCYYSPLEGARARNFFSDFAMHVIQYPQVDCRRLETLFSIKNSWLPLVFTADLLPRRMHGRRSFRSFEHCHRIRLLHIKLHHRRLIKRVEPLSRWWWHIFIASDNGLTRGVYARAHGYRLLSSLTKSTKPQRNGIIISLSARKQQWDARGVKMCWRNVVDRERLVPSPTIAQALSCLPTHEAVHA